MATTTNKKQSKTRIPGIGMVRNRSSTVYNVVFTNRKLFPSFLELPNERYPNPIYYRPTMIDTIVPIRPWFFLGEITDETNALSEWARHRIYVRDIDGQQRINIDFYPNSNRVNTFDYSLFKRGHTVCINFGSQHYFLDGKHGIRVENYKKVHVFPVSLNTLLTTISNEMKENMPLHQKDKPSKGEILAYAFSGKGNELKYKPPPPPHCWHCKNNETDDLKMKRCAKCCLATYCQKSCQTEHWNTSHKQSCKCLRFYTPMVTSMKTSLDNMSQYLLDFVSTDDSSSSDDEDKKEKQELSTENEDNDV